MRRRRRGRAAPGRARATGGRGPTSTAGWPRPPTLAERGADLVDLHGQHDHQSLLAAAVQRERARPLRRHRPRAAARRPARRCAAIDERLAALGGDEREPGPRDRPAALPGRRARRRRPRRPRRGRAPRGRGGPARPTPPAHREAAAARRRGARRRRRRRRRGWPTAIAALDGRRPVRAAGRRGCAALAAELADVAAELRAAGRGDRGRSRAAGRGPRAPAAAARPAAQVRRDAGRRHRVPRRGRARGWPSSRPATRLAAELDAERRERARPRSRRPRRVVGAARRAAAPDAGRGRRGAPAPSWPCPRPASRSTVGRRSRRRRRVPARRQPRRAAAAAGQGRRPAASWPGRCWRCAWC